MKSRLCLFGPTTTSRQQNQVSLPSINNAVSDPKITGIRSDPVFTMTTEETEEFQSGIEDGGMGGPGAPTPLSALEVQVLVPESISVSEISS